MARKSSQSDSKTVPGSVLNMVLHSTATGLHLLPELGSTVLACLQSFYPGIFSSIIQYYIKNPSSKVNGKI